jgi:hypothetical protein
VQRGKIRGRGPLRVDDDEPTRLDDPAQLVEQRRHGRGQVRAGQQHGVRAVRGAQRVQPGRGHVERGVPIGGAQFVADSQQRSGQPRPVGTLVERGPALVTQVAATGRERRGITVGTSWASTVRPHCNAQRGQCVATPVARTTTSPHRNEQSPNRRTR